MITVPQVLSFNLAWCKPKPGILHPAFAQVGKIVSAKRNDPSQFGHESFLVELKDPVSNRR